MSGLNNFFLVPVDGNEQSQVPSLKNQEVLLTISDIHKLYIQKLQQDYGLSNESDYNDRDERNKRTFINRKALAAKKYLTYLADFGGVICLQTLKTYKNLIKDRYEKEKIKYSTYRIHTNSGTKHFIEWCKENKISYCRKDLPKKKYKVVGEEVVLRFSEWLTSYKKVDYETDTSYNHILRLNKLYRFMEKQELKNSFSSTNVNLFLQSNSELNISTRNNYRATFRLFATFLLQCLEKEEDKLNEGDPGNDKLKIRKEQLKSLRAEFQKIQKLKKKTDDRDNKIKIALTREQREYLYSCCKTPRQRVMVALAAYSGLRAVSIQRLKWEDVNSETRTIMIWNKGSNVKKERPVPSIVMKALVDQRASVGEVSESDYVLESQRGGGYKRKAVSISILSLLITAGLREIEVFGRKWKTGAHTLRHTFATRLLEDTSGDILAVSHMLCHADTQTTMEYLKYLKMEKANSLYIGEYDNIFGTNN